MSVDLSKCKVGDTLVRRDGKCVKLDMINEHYIYPYRTSDGQTHTREGNIWMCNGLSKLDIVAIKSKPRVAKCYFERVGSGECIAMVLFSAYKHHMAFTTKRNAILGVKRFCKTIGFECEIMEEPA